MPTKEKLYSTAVAARLAGADYQALWRAVCRHELPSTNPEQPRLLLDDVRAWLATKDGGAE